MLNFKKLTKSLWAEVVNIACYIINHAYLCLGTKKTFYELWK